MKKISLTAIAVILISILLAILDFYISVSDEIYKSPEHISIDFYSKKNIIWHRHFIKKRYSSHIDKKKFSRERIDSINSLLLDIYSNKRSLKKENCNRKWALSFFLSPLLFDRDELSIPYIVQRLREYKNMILLYLMYDENILLESLLNRKPFNKHVYGVDMLSEIIHKKGSYDISDVEFLEIVNILFKNGVRPSLYKKGVRAYIRKMDDKFRYGKNFADHCLREIRNKNFPLNESLKVYTTLNYYSQINLEKSALQYIKEFKSQPERRVDILKKLPFIETAVVIADNKSGAVESMIGSVEYKQESQFNRAVNSRRQISSTVKPFLYSLAIESKKLTADSEFEDKPVKMKNRDGSPWEPRNFYPFYLGKVNLRKALVISINTIAVQLIKLTGVNEFCNKAREVFYLPYNSIEKRILSEPSLSLGSIELTPLEVAKGYLILANRGKEVFPYFIEQIKDDSGRVLFKHDSSSLNRKRIYSKKTVNITRDMLKDVITRGTASAFLERPFAFDVAGKSGSSPSDSWFAGFSPEKTIVTWAGYDNPIKRRELKLPQFIVIPLWFSLMQHSNPTDKNFPE